MTRISTLLAASTAALVIAGLLSPYARAADPSKPGGDSSGGAADGCAETGIPWIVATPENCNIASQPAPVVRPNEMEIHPLPAGGEPLFVDASGQPGTVTSSARYKTGIVNMDYDPAKLLELRPVTFHYKADANGPVQYGLIAEEVEKLFPDLVVRGADGTVRSVRYDELSAILLKEIQTQQAAMREQQKQLDAQAETMKTQYHQLEAEDEQIRYLGDRVAQMQKLVEKLTKSSQ